MSPDYWNRTSKPPTEEKRCITEKSLSEAATILKLWSSMAVDPAKQALIQPVIDLLSTQRDAPGGKQVTFFITSDKVPEKAPWELEPGVGL